MNNINILWVGNSYTSVDAGVRSHAHPYFHMICILSGCADFTVNDTQMRLQGGTVILVPTNVRHAYSNSGETTMHYLEIKFTLNKSSLEPLLPKSEACVCENALAVSLCRQIVDEYSESGNKSDDAAISYLAAVINLITASTRRGSSPSSHYIDVSSYSELSRRIIEYLEAHYAENIVLDDLAESLDYNKAYLCTAFKKDTLTTILDSLNTIRIRHAAELIVYSDNSLAQVASMCGFSSVSHFNSVFSKYVGITPGQCRRAYPVDILFGSYSGKDSKSESRPDRFMYSVLGRKKVKT